jgi:hypothetical protein
MSNYRQGSNWNDANELRCLQVMLKLQEEKFPRGLQAQLCRQLDNNSKLKYPTLSAKVGNYKSVAGYTKPTNASNCTIHFFNLFGHLRSGDLTNIIQAHMS